MSRKNRLFDLEIDEVSSVDRPANQLGLIAFAKSLGDQAPEEGGMTAQTDEAPSVEFEHGGVYEGDDGQAYVYVELDEDGAPLPVEGLDLSDVDFSDDAEDEVGKATGWKALKPYLATAGRQTKDTVKNNPGKTAAVGATAAGIAGGGAYMEAKKSAGTAVLEALSKAVTDSDRDAIVAAIAEENAVTKAALAEMTDALDTERDIRITEAFIAKAADYNLPVDPAEFGPILKACAEVLDDDQLDTLDAVLKSAGTALYEELGYAGGASNSGVLDEVSGLAAELVGKAAGSVTLEQASTAIYETNPAAYDAYLAEQNGR